VQEFCESSAQWNQMEEILLPTSKAYTGGLAQAVQELRSNVWLAFMVMGNVKGFNLFKSQILYPR
jgi:hypothetical protein